MRKTDKLHAWQLSLKALTSLRLRRVVEDDGYF